MTKSQILLLTAALLLPAFARAQTAGEFKARYERQVRNAGADGVGVEYILDNWAEAYPDDAEMFRGRFQYCLAKGRSSSVEEKASKTYLGKDPMLVLNDKDGRPVYYYEVVAYDEDFFGRAVKYIETAIRLAPEEIAYRFDKISALLGYEGGSPDMTTAELLGLMDYNFSRRPSWTYAGEAFPQEDFSRSMQEYCYLLFNIGTPLAMENFRALSERMKRYEPANADWIANEGAYWQKAEKNYKKAMKCYNKALKMDPGNYAANQNKSVVERIQKLQKNHKK